MLCPRCHRCVLTPCDDGFLSCAECGLRRRPQDRKLEREDTCFWTIGRNIQRTPTGLSMELDTCGQQLFGSEGVFEGGTNYMLRAVESKLVLATSYDLGDLAILIIEKGWMVSGPKTLLDLMDVIAA